METRELWSATPPVIKATVHDDEWRYDVKFDALPWFQQASDEDILNLAKVDWGGDYEADGVAEFCEDTDANVKRLCRGRNRNGAG